MPPVILGVMRFLKKHAVWLWLHLAYLVACDKAFARKMRRFMHAYQVNSSPRYYLFLAGACKPSVFTSSVKKVFANAGDAGKPEITLVVLANDQPGLLERCLFILNKQTERSFEVLVMGGGPSPRHRSLLKDIPITYVTLNDNQASANIHRLAMPHVKGRFVLFLHATDVVHPTLCRHVMALGDSAGGTLVFCRSDDAVPLPSSQIITLCSKPVSQETVVDPESGLFSFTARDILHKAFTAEKLRETLSAWEPDHALSPWARCIDTLTYCLHSSSMVITESVLIKTSSIPAAYQELKQFAESLKIGAEPFYRHLQQLLPGGRGEDIFRHIMFSAVPFELSRLYDKHLENYHLSVIYSHVAFYLEWCRKAFPAEAGDIMSATFAGLHYGRFMGGALVNAVHAYFIEECGNRPDGICLYDNEGLNDLEHHMLPVIQTHYSVEYISKRKFCEYGQLEQLVFAIIVSRTAMVLASFWVHRYATIGRKVIQVWHGNGMMKKILPPSSPMFQQDYVLASSEDCRAVYPEIFSVPAQNVLTFGTIQTDLYFDREQTEKGREQALAEFDDLAGKRICFYAPTFRQFTTLDVPSLYCGWDYTQMDEGLQKANSLLIYKKHHMLKNLKTNKGINLCDLDDSPGRFVRESHINDIFPWICACDIFMTDYSSALFFPLLLNKPVVFYTPDLDEFLTRGNGTLIDYVATVPGPIVTSSSAAALLQAMDEAPAYVNTDKYKKFKEFHMGSCDGKARERLLEFIDRHFADEQRRLAPGAHI